jgi:hypothetical protein
MGCFSPKAPPPPNYGQITRDTLQAQVDLAPQQYASEATYQPLYTDLALSNLNSLLYGTPGGQETYQQTITADRAGWYGPDGQYLGSDRYQYYTPGSQAPQRAPGLGGLVQAMNPNVTSGGTQQVPEGVRWLGKGGTMQVTGTRTRTPQTGLLELMQGAQASQRAADIADVMTLGPQAREALLAANPESAALLAKLNAQANAGLDAGSSLTPEEQRAMQQASRAAFAARGMGGSNSAITDELLRQFDLGQQLLRQRQAFAQSVLANNQQLLGDPFMQILGRGSNAVGQAQGVWQGAGPSLFNPQAGLGLAASNYATAANFAAANNPLANIGNILGGVGRAAGGIAQLF